jgi:hypothetical protein
MKPILLLSEQDIQFSIHFLELNPQKTNKTNLSDKQ